MEAPLTPNERSIALYRRHAAGYDASAARTMALRRRVIGLLALQPGEVVLDVGAGTGLSYEPLRQAVGPLGRVLAFEQSPEMFERAAARVAAQGFGNVWQVCASAEAVQLPAAPDALLFNYVHDITRTPEALANLVRQAKPGARIAVCGMKFFPWWTGPLNLLAWAKNRPYNARAAELWRPWSLLEPLCADWRREGIHGGMGYVAWGRLK
jgi:demethylmenaquinone methyltransferase/2-methoxy-6-polyprenyl-1,4-benzoquinol methylase